MPFFAFLFLFLLLSIKFNTFPNQKITWSDIGCLSRAPFVWFLWLYV